jgi:hypothetical protein
LCEHRRYQQILSLETIGGNSPSLTDHAQSPIV